MSFSNQSAIWKIFQPIINSYKWWDSVAVNFSNIGTILRKQQPFMNIPHSLGMYLFVLLAIFKTCIVSRGFERETIHPRITCPLFWILTITYHINIETTPLTVIIMIPYMVVLTIGALYCDVQIVPFVMIFGANFYPPLQFLWDLYLVISTFGEFLSEMWKTDWHLRRTLTIVTILLCFYNCFLKYAEGNVAQKSIRRGAIMPVAGIFLMAFAVVGLFVVKLPKVVVYSVTFNLCIFMTYLL